MGVNEGAKPPDKAVEQAKRCFTDVQVQLTIKQMKLKATPHKACAEDAPTGSMSADSVQSRQAGFVRCCLKHDGERIKL